MGELLLIAVVALLAVGPDRLPNAARSIGRGIRDIRRQTDDLQQTLESDGELGEAIKDLRTSWQGKSRPLAQRRRDLGKALDQMTRPTENAGGAPRREKLAASAAPSADDDAIDAPAEPDGAAPVSSPEADQDQPDDDDLPRIVAPAGTVPRGRAAPAAGADEPAPTGAGEGDAVSSSEPPKPAHG